AAPLAAIFPPRNRLSRNGFALPIQGPPTAFIEERPFAPDRFSRGFRTVPNRPQSAWRKIMAYDRYDTRDERSRWSSDRSRDWDRDRSRGHSDRDERGFFERAGDEISSWFGDDDGQRGRRDERSRDDRSGGADRQWEGGQGRGY